MSIRLSGHNSQVKVTSAWSAVVAKSGMRCKLTTTATVAGSMKELSEHEQHQTEAVRRTWHVISGVVGNDPSAMSFLSVRGENWGSQGVILGWSHEAERTLRVRLHDSGAEWN